MDRIQPPRSSPGWLEHLVTGGWVLTTIVPAVLALALGWRVDASAYEVTAQVIPVLFLALALDVRMFQLEDKTGPRGEVATAFLGVLLIVGEAVAFAAFSAHWHSRVPLAIGIVAVGTPFWMIIARSFIGSVKT